MLSMSTACIFSGEILSMPDSTPLDTWRREKENRSCRTGCTDLLATWIWAVRYLQSIRRAYSITLEFFNRYYKFKRNSRETPVKIILRCWYDARIGAAVFSTRFTYRCGIFRIDAGAVQKHTALVNKGWILIIIIPYVYRQRGRRCESLGDVPRPIL